jgi:hypothetical protein
VQEDRKEASICDLTDENLVLTDSNNLTTTTTDKADLLCNDQESLENSSNKSDNTIADETNSGDCMLENNKFVMIDNSCQTNDQTANERSWGLNTAQDHSCTWDQVSTDIESLKSKMPTFLSSVLSFENVLKDHDDTILSLYNRVADLNEKYLSEINEKTRYINSIEQKLTKVEEERDSLQLATRLIAQDKLCQYRGNSVACQCRKATPYHGKKLLIVITFIKLAV